MIWIGVGILLLLILLALSQILNVEEKEKEKRKKRRRRTKQNKKQSRHKTREKGVMIRAPSPPPPPCRPRLSLTVASGKTIPCPVEYWYLTTVEQQKHNKWLMWKETPGKVTLRFDEVNTTTSSEKPDPSAHAKWLFWWPTGFECRENDDTRYNFFFISNMESHKVLTYFRRDEHHGVWGMDYMGEGYDWQHAVQRQVVTHPVNGERYWKLWFLNAVYIQHSDFCRFIECGMRHIFSLGPDGGEVGAIGGHPPNDDRQYWVIKRAA